MGLPRFEQISLRLSFCVLEAITNVPNIISPAPPLRTCTLWNPQWPCDRASIIHGQHLRSVTCVTIHFYVFELLTSMNRAQFWQVLLTC